MVTKTEKKAKIVVPPPKALQKPTGKVAATPATKIEAKVEKQTPAVVKKPVAAVKPLSPVKTKPTPKQSEVKAGTKIAKTTAKPAAKPAIKKGVSAAELLARMQQASAEQFR